MICDHGMFHALLCDRRSKLYSNTCDRTSVSDMFPCFYILSVFDCTGQMFCDVFNRGQGGLNACLPKLL